MVLYCTVLYDGTVLRGGKCIAFLVLYCVMGCWGAGATCYPLDSNVKVKFNVCVDVNVAVLAKLSTTRTNAIANDKRSSTRSMLSMPMSVALVKVNIKRP